MKELEESAFISRDASFWRLKRDAIYRLIDEYCLFHLTWVDRMRGEGQGYRHGTPSWRAWAGLAFDAICLKHVEQIRRGLGISGVSTVRSGWQAKTDKEGAQIDLVVDRADNCINLCEMKYSDEPFTITKSYAQILRRKIRMFRDVTRTRKNLFLTMVTTHGCRHNPNLEELVDSELTMDALITQDT